ncbi:MAG: sigma 54-interacting transcriptional regulator [Candidatus Schekmanbacteria bacterium]|nr:sigma 54-interacting transcriptional regulator [Candidatus Schekmanbacteria bacterium]
MAAPQVAQRHLAVLRALLQRDYLTTANWDAATRDIAVMARQALEASEAIVAFFDPETGKWCGTTSGGDRLTDDRIQLFGSRSVLEAVRSSGIPVLTTTAVPLDLTSVSIVRHAVRSVLAVPLYRWDVREQKPRRTFWGCLYAHRSGLTSPFTDADVALVLDLTELAHRSLNLLHHLKAVETDLESFAEELKELRAAAADSYRLGNLASRDPWFAENVLEPLRRLAIADKVGILILGPTGSGKSHLAQAYHYECPRRNGPFVVLDCSQITSGETLAAELFGYAPSSGFAGAPPKGRPGKAQLADKGTLFVDEVACLSPELQQRLLQLIETGFYSPLGSSERLHVDIQVLSATNEDLPALVGAGRFREDLFWRVSLVTVRLPPLSERPADVPRLAESFLRKAAERYGRTAIASFSESAMTRLMRHDWSRAGNIRGLAHTVERSVLLAPAGATMLDERHIMLHGPFEYGAVRSAPVLGTATLPVLAPASGGGSGELAVTAQAPARAAGEESDTLAALVRNKIREHGGTVTSMAVDPEVSAAFGYRRESMPVSTLTLRIRELGLQDEILRVRQTQCGGHTLADIKASVRAHTSGSAAARALGISRDSLVWQLRKAGLTIRDVLMQMESEK